MKKSVFLGIDIGGTKISFGVVNPKGEILFWQKIPNSSKTKKDITKEIIKQIKIISSISAKENCQIKGIGIGIPGIIDLKTQRILRTPNTKLNNINLKEILEKEFTMPVIIDNDVNLGLLGEKWLGAAKNYKNAIGIFIGTGIGGAIILNNQIYRGSHNAAGEIGHIIIKEKGKKCTCANKGCLEAYASRWAIEKNIKKALKKGELSLKAQQLIGKVSRGRKRIKSKTIKKLLKIKEPKVIEILTQASWHIADASISLRHIFDPEIIVFGGGLIEACGWFILPKIKNKLKKDPFFLNYPLTIAESSLKDNAVILGAIAELIKQL